jgi:HEAT repeat protein
MGKIRRGQFLKRTARTAAILVGAVVAFSSLKPSAEPAFPVAKAQAAENRVQKNIRLLKSGEPKQRRMAAEMLGIIGNPGAFPELMEALDDTDAAVRANAAEALGKIRDPGAKPALINKLKDPSEDVRINAALALGVIGVDEKEFTIILGMLREGSQEEKGSAAIALGALQRTEAVQPLIEALESCNSDVMVSIGWALTNIGKPAVPALIGVLKNADPYTRTFAAYLLGEIGDAKALPALREVAQKYPVKEVRDAVQEAIAAISERQ